MKNTTSPRSERDGCKQCGKPTPRKSAKFCDRTCSTEWRTGRPQGAAPRPKCKQCGKPCRKVQNEFCGSPCFCAWRKAQPFKPKVKRVKNTCEQCREPFFVLPAVAKKRKFCDRECYHAARVIDMETTTNTSVNTSAWRRWRKEILKRDNWKCVFCSRPANSVHHLVPRDAGGTHAKANLAAACIICHNAIDKVMNLMQEANADVDLADWIIAYLLPGRRT